MQMKADMARSPTMPISRSVERARRHPADGARERADDARPENCQKISPSQWVSRSLRVVVMAQANMAAPPSAIRAAPEKAAPVGLQRDHHADEADQHGGPAERAHLLAEKGTDRAVMISGAAR